MATREHCPNCKNDKNGFVLTECKDCQFVGCHGGVFGTSGCWTKTKCPHCGSTHGRRRLGYVGDYDSN